jgi:hypothetical protein
LNITARGKRIDDLYDGPANSGTIIARFQFRVIVVVSMEGTVHVGICGPNSHQIGGNNSNEKLRFIWLPTITIRSQIVEYGP